MVFFALMRPSWEWDIIPYTMIVLKGGVSDIATAHAKAYALIEAYVPAMCFRRTEVEHTQQPDPSRQSGRPSELPAPLGMQAGLRVAPEGHRGVHRSDRRHDRRQSRRHPGDVRHTVPAVLAPAGNRRSGLAAAHRAVRPADHGEHAVARSDHHPRLHGGLRGVPVGEMAGGVSALRGRSLPAAR